jgi:hypothetical protein
MWLALLKRCAGTCVKSRSVWSALIRAPADFLKKLGHDPSAILLGEMMINYQIDLSISTISVGLRKHT